jgi:two-component system LytT family response regulator
MLPQTHAEAPRARVGHAAIRTVVVDDEPLARDWIRQHLRADSEVELVAECEDGFQAVEAIDRLRPDLVLLDVQMPGLDGFGVLGMLENGPPPAVVFVTAFDSYALRAFEVHAIDYLLKPVSPERLQQAIGRSKQRLERAMTEDTARELLALLREVRRYPDWFLVKVSGRSHFVRVKDIDWIESRRNDVLFHVGAATHVYHDTTSGMEGRLDPTRFLRIHRSTIVAIDRIKELHPWFNGDYEVILRDGTKLTMSSGYKQRLRAFRRGLI